MTREPGEEGDERRLVDVSPGQVLSAGHVIHLVAEIAVAIGSEELKEEKCGGDEEDNRRPMGETGPSLDLPSGSKSGSGHGSPVYGGEFVMSTPEGRRLG